MSASVIVEPLNEYADKLLVSNFNKIEKLFHKTHSCKNERSKTELLHGISIYKRESHEEALSHKTKEYQKKLSNKLLMEEREYSRLHISTAWSFEDTIQAAKEMMKILGKIMKENDWASYYFSKHPYYMKHSTKEEYQIAIFLGSDFIIFMSFGSMAI